MKNLMFQNLFPVMSQSDRSQNRLIGARLFTWFILLFLLDWGILFQPARPRILQAKNLGQTDGNLFRLSLQDGSVLIIEIADQTFEWSEVLDNGDVQARVLSTHDIRNLSIGNEGLSDQVRQVQQWLRDLGSPAYEDREQAEKALSESAVALRFKNLIEVAVDHPDFEVSYRATRILEFLRRANIQPGISNELSSESFDRLQLTNGETSVGDCGEFEMIGQFRGNNFRLNRQLISGLSRISEPSPSDLRLTQPKERESTPFRVDVFQRYQDEFYLEHQTLVDFEKSPTGEDLPMRFNVNSLYQNKGLLLNSEKPGYIGISGYRFRSADPPGGNSVCVFEAVGNSFKRYKGVMEIRFCVPNQPHRAAGVHEFGLFLTRVDNPRDFIMEAYDVDGHLLAAVEASDAQTVFTGIKSTEPIAFLRVLNNPFLYLLKRHSEDGNKKISDDLIRIGFNRKIDEDYCADDFIFSEPIPLDSVSIHEKDQDELEDLGDLIVMKDGNRLRGSALYQRNLLIVRSKHLMEKMGPLEVPLADVHAIHFRKPSKPVPKGQRVWMAQMIDGTILRVDPTDHFRVEWFDGLQLPADQIVAIWLAPNQLRYPWMLPNMVDPQFPLLVFPTCIFKLTDLAMTEEGYRWDRHQKIEQDIFIRALANDDGSLSIDRGSLEDDPTPDITQIDFESTSIELIPTLWLQAPVNKNPTWGQIRLVDGQSFTLGGELGLQLLAMDEDSVTIGWLNQQQQIPLAQIDTIRFPETNNR